MAKRGENIYKRKDGRWEARVIKGYNEHGKALYAYFYGRNYREVKDKIFAPIPHTKTDSDSPPDTGEQTPCFGDVLDKWLKFKEVSLKRASYIKYFNLINNHVKPSLGSYSLPDISSTVLNDYIMEKHRTGKRIAVGGLSEKTVKDIMTVIKSVLRYAREEGFLSNTININLTLPREKPKEPHSRRTS